MLIIQIRLGSYWIGLDFKSEKHDLSRNHYITQTRSPRLQPYDFVPFYLKN